MKAIGVIPARWGSTRFEGKVLADIKGKPMIQHVWERSRQSQKLDDVLIACDDERVSQTAEGFGAKVVMTSKEHASGTDRIAEAVRSLETDLVVNIQGDEPLIEPSVIDDLVQSLRGDDQCVMSTAIKILTDEKEINNPNVVKVVIDQSRNALYFSRSVIPFHRDQKQSWTGCYKHLGLYAYRKDFLLSFGGLPKSELEEAEQLEQLRVLEAGYKIKTVETETETVSVDTPEDLAKVIEQL